MILQYIRLWLGNNSARKHHGTCHCNFQKTSRIIVWKSYISRTRTSNMALCTTETNQKETKLGRRKTSPEFAAENCGPGKALIAYETLKTFASRANPYCHSHVSQRLCEMRVKTECAVSFIVFSITCGVTKHKTLISLPSATPRSRLRIRNHSN